MAQLPGKKKVKTSVFISGNGSNLKSLIKFSKTKKSPISIELIISDKDFRFQIMGTHPHQIHFEILSETGLFGFLSFTIFILYSIFYSLKSYFKSRNKYQLSAILFILCTLIPFLPSGSFFSRIINQFFIICIEFLP